MDTGQLVNSIHLSEESQRANEYQESNMLWCFWIIIVLIFLILLILSLYKCHWKPRPVLGELFCPYLDI